MSKRSKKRKRVLIILGAVAAFFLILHLILEPVALYYVNRALGNLKGYKGSVEDIKIRLFRGAYRIEGLVIEKVNNEKSEPFFKAPGIDISIEWGSLFKGSIVAEFSLERPVLNFIRSGDTVETGGGNDFVQTIKELSPIHINRFEVIDGEVHYIDYTSSPNLDLVARNVNGVATNLRNVEERDKKFPADIRLTAQTEGGGVIRSDMKINVLKEMPDFDFNFELKDMNLTQLASLTEAYANFTFKRGTMYLATELTMVDGRYEGYIKPVLEDVKVIDLSKEARKRDVWKQLWELVVGTGAFVTKNQFRDRIATRIPLEGDLQGSKSFTLEAILNIFRNAYIKAFEKTLEGSLEKE